MNPAIPLGISQLCALQFIIICWMLFNATGAFIQRRGRCNALAPLLLSGTAFLLLWRLYVLTQ